MISGTPPLAEPLFGEDSQPPRFHPLTHPILFQEPRRLSTFSIWRGHIPFAMLLVELTNPTVLVELGTHYGDSYCSFCQAVQQLHLPTRTYAVDTWEGDSQAGYYDSSVLEDLRAHHDPLYRNFSTLLQSTFDGAVSHFSDGSIDVLHIDGLHTYEAVRHDFETWLPKMSRRGIVLLHDTSATHGDFGVYRFWDELTERYPHFAFTHASGLGMIAVGETYPPSLAAFFEATPLETERLRTFFQFAGDRHLFQGDLALLNKELIGVREHLRQVESHVDMQSKVIDESILRLREGEIERNNLANERQLLETEVGKLREAIRYMEGSPFWKMRNRFHGLRRQFGIAKGRG